MKTAVFFVLVAVASVLGAAVEKKTEKRGVLGLGYGGWASPPLGLYNHGFGHGLYGSGLYGHGLYGGALSHGALVAPPVLSHGVIGSPLVAGHGLVGAPVVGHGLYGGLGPWGLGLGHGVLH